MIDIIGLGSSLLVAKPLVAMPRLLAAYNSDQESEDDRPRRKYRTMPGRKPDPRFRQPSTPKASDYPA